MRDVFEKLVEEGEIQREDIQSVEAFLNARQEMALQPWYIRGCAGLAAWLAALFFIVALAYDEIITDGVSALIAGLIFCAVAVGINRSRVGSDFAWQGALALCLGGQLLFVYGVHDWIGRNNVSFTMLATIALEAVLIWFYNSRLLRFISTGVIVGASVLLLFDLDLLNLIPFLAILLAVATALLWENEALLIRLSVADIYQPVGYGLALGMLGVITLPVLSPLDVSLWWVSTIGLEVVLLGLIYWIVTDHGLSLQTGGVALAFLGASLLGIPAIRVPGIIGSLITLLLGFHKGNRVLMGIAGIFMAYFVTLFYYDIEITLLLKSIALMGSGIVFLLIRFTILQALFPREDSS